MKNKIKVVAVSDTHNEHDNIIIDNCDLFIHAGDLTKKGTYKEVINGLDWISNKINAKHKILISGNHDYYFNNIKESKDLCKSYGIDFIQDETINIFGYKIYGEGSVPLRGNSAFVSVRNSFNMIQLRNKIPETTEILITHCPPFGILDKNTKGDNCGCKFLTCRVNEISPKHHVFGHIHQGFGYKKINGTKYNNVAYLSPKGKRITTFYLDKKP